jgi:hypothetical protein
MAIKLGDAVLFFRGDSSPLHKDMDKSHGEVKAWTIAVGNFIGQTITKGFELAGRALGDFARGLVQLTQDAIKTQGVENVFKSLVTTIGVDAVSAIEALRTATRGMVSDDDLLAAGNEFLATGLATTSEELARLTNMSTQLGIAMGKGPAEAMSSFATVLTNQSTRALKEFGISATDVRNRVDELTAADKNLSKEDAFRQAVMEAGTALMTKIGDQSGTTAAGMARISSSIENLKNVAGDALLPIANMFLGFANDLIGKYGPQIEEGLRFIRGPIEDITAAFTLLAQGDPAGFFGKLSDALIGLGVPRETVDKIIDCIVTLFSAINDLKNGNVEEFIGKMKAILLELGVPIETIDMLERAFRSAFNWITENVPKAQAVIREIWENVIKPAFEGWKYLAEDLGPVLKILGGIILLSFVGPIILAALPVIALGAALIALGLIWKEFGDDVTKIVTQLGVIIRFGIGQMINSIISFITTLAAIDPTGLLAKFGPGVIDTLTRARDDLQRQNLEAIQRESEIQSRGLTFNTQANFESLMGILGRTQAQQGNNMTVYGGVQQYGLGMDTGSIESLWELNQ